MLVTVLLLAGAGQDRWPVTSPSATVGVRYRTRGEERRDRRFELKLSAAEHAMLMAAAARGRLTLAAYIVQAAMDAAELRTAPVGAVQREMLAELIRIAGTVTRAGLNFSQAASQLSPDGADGVELEQAAAYCLRVVRHVDDAAERLRRRLP
jgi:hypothetical protein